MTTQVSQVSMSTNYKNDLDWNRQSLQAQKSELLEYHKLEM